MSAAVGVGLVPNYPAQTTHPPNPRPVSCTLPPVQSSERTCVCYIGTAVELTQSYITGGSQTRGGRYTALVSRSSLKMGLVINVWSPSRPLNVLYTASMFFFRRNNTSDGLEKRLHELRHAISQLGLFLEGQNMTCLVPIMQRTRQ